MELYVIAPDRFGCPDPPPPPPEARLFDAAAAVTGPEVNPVFGPLVAAAVIVVVVVAVSSPSKRLISFGSNDMSTSLTAWVWWSRTAAVICEEALPPSWLVFKLFCAYKGLICVALALLAVAAAPAPTFTDSCRELLSNNRRCSPEAEFLQKRRAGKNRDTHRHWERLLMGMMIVVGFAKQPTARQTKQGQNKKKGEWLGSQIFSAYIFIPIEWRDHSSHLDISHGRLTKKQWNRSP